MIIHSPQQLHSKDTASVGLPGESTQKSGSENLDAASPH